MSIQKIDVQTSKKTKDAKGSKTPLIWTALNRARRMFHQQLKVTQNNTTKIACIKEVASEVYKHDPYMVWYDLVKESKRLTNLIDFNKYCNKMQRNPDFVAQNVTFEGSGVVNKVMRYGVEAVLGERILAYDEPLFNPVKIRGLLDAAKPIKSQVKIKPVETECTLKTVPTLVEKVTVEAETITPDIDESAA